MADKQQKETTDAAAEAVRKYLGEITKDNKTRQIRQMGMHEVQGVAIAAIGAYVQARQRQEDGELLKSMIDEDLNDPIDDIPLA